MPWYTLKTFRADPNMPGGGYRVAKTEFLAQGHDAATQETQSVADSLPRRFFVVLFDEAGARLLITQAQD